MWNCQSSRFCSNCNKVQGRNLQIGLPNLVLDEKNCENPGLFPLPANFYCRTSTAELRSLSLLLHDLIWFLSMAHFLFRQRACTAIIWTAVPTLGSDDVAAAFTGGERRGGRFGKLVRVARTLNFQWRLSLSLRCPTDWCNFDYSTWNLSIDY